MKLIICRKYKIISIVENDAFLLDFNDGFFNEGVILHEIGNEFTCYKVMLESTGNFYYLKFGAKFKKL